MGKGRSLQEDKTTLQTKFASHRKKEHGAEEELAVRRLHKRLKRVQRKLRSRAARIAQAAGKKGAAKT